MLIIPATILLIVHTQAVSFMAGVAAETIPSGAEGRRRIELVVYTGAAVLVLLAAMALSVYKPRGLTRYGVRKQGEQGDGGADTRAGPYRGSIASKPRWVKIFGTIVLVLVVVLVILRHAGIVGTGMHHMAH